MTQPRPFTTVAPPPAAGLAIAYFTPLMAPTPVATRTPQPSKTEDTINNFLRIEAAGGTPLREQLLFQTSILLHCYCTNNQESAGEQTLGKALAWGGNAQGTWITHPSTGDEYFVAASSITALAEKTADPAVALTRWRGMVTWLIQGKAI